MNVPATLARLRAAANAISLSRDATSWSEDLAQEVMAMMLEGVRVRLDRQGLSWVMHGLLDKWLDCRRQPHNVRAVALEMTTAPPLPSTWAELREIWHMATDAQRSAIYVLLTEGGYRRDGATKKERMRTSQALYTLRWVIS